MSPKISVRAPTVKWPLIVTLSVLSATILVAAIAWTATGHLQWTSSERFDGSVTELVITVNDTVATDFDGVSQSGKYLFEYITWYTNNT